LERFEVTEGEKFTGIWVLIRVSWYSFWLRYIEIMKRHELQISQPAVDGASSWPITVRQSWTGKEVHKRTPWEGLFDNCTKSKVTPPCAGYAHKFFSERQYDVGILHKYVLENVKPG
jgi:hypothetical protein